MRSFTTLPIIQAAPESMNICPSHHLKDCRVSQSVTKIECGLVPPCTVTWGTSEDLQTLSELPGHKASVSPLCFCTQQVFEKSSNASNMKGTDMPFVPSLAEHGHRTPSLRTEILSFFSPTGAGRLSAVEKGDVPRRTIEWRG